MNFKTLIDSISEEERNELLATLSKKGEASTKKYELTGAKVVNNRTLYQIRALKDFSNVKKGDLGGWIEKEDNLSQEGDCWVYGDAWVYGAAQVYGNAWVFEEAQVYGNAQVYGDCV
jgi:hypothetical protein